MENYTPITSPIDLDQFEQRLEKRFRLKKTVNAIFSMFIAVIGVSTLVADVFVYHNNLFHQMRYMTFDGTIFTIVISLFSCVIFIRELLNYREVTTRFLYFIRLSAATTEFVIFAVVVFGLSPLVPDKPDVTTYMGVMMHLVIPFLMLFSFQFNDAPTGRLKPLEPFKGTIFITIYAIVMLILFGCRILPSSLAPYSFLDFDNTGWGYKLACMFGIYLVGYLISLLLSNVNRLLSWVWFADRETWRRARKK